MGTLIPLEREEFPLLTGVVHGLLRHRKPVVWFDRVNQGFGSDVDRSWFYRCHPDHATAALEILKALTSYGHRSIGIPRFHYHKWMDSVIDSFVRAAESFDPAPRIEVARETSPVGPVGMSQRPAWKVIRWLSTSTGDGYIQQSLRDLADTIPGSIKKLAKADPSLNWGALEGKREFPVDIFTILWMTPVILPLVRDRGVTALVCPGGKYASFYFYWARAARLAVPRHLSYACVDNSYEFFPYPMSSVDLGYDRMGYAAAHVFLDDIPVRSDREGNITVPARFIQRGSVAPPRKGRIHPDMLKGLEWEMPSAHRSDGVVE
jgi:hypothetical protein